MEGQTSPSELGRKFGGMKEAVAINPSMGWLLSITEDGVWQLIPWAKRPFHRGIFVSWTHVAWASKQTAGGGTNKLVLLMIADATSHDSPMLVAKIDRLAKLCELNEKTVRNALRDLEDRGLIGTVLRFFEGQQIANGYFLMGEEWVDAAKDRIRSESHRDGYSCRLKVDSSNTLREIPEHPSNNARTLFGRGAGGDAALGRAEMPGGAGGDAEQLLPSSFIPSSHTEFSPPFASLSQGSPADEQQPERAAEHQTTASPSQTPVLPPEQPLPSGATPHPPHCAAPPSPSGIAYNPAGIYALYPRKEGRAAALKAIEKAIKTDGYAVVMEATEAYAKAVSMWPDGDRRFIPHPATWFNQQRYLDDRTAWVRKAPAPVGRFTAPPQTFAKL